METVERQAIRSITLFVIAIHAALLFWAWIDYESPPLPKKIVKLVATTVQLNPKPQSFSQRREIASIPVESFDDVMISSSEEVAMVEEQAKPLPQLDKTTVKAIPKDEIKIEPKKKVIKEIPKAAPPKPQAKSKPKPIKETPKPTPEVAKAAKPSPKPAPETAKIVKVAQKRDPKKQALLNQVQALAANVKTDAVKTAKKGELKIPEYHPQATIATEEGSSSGEISYRDELASRLQLLLKLPEMGKVQLKLTLSKTGKFVKLVIVSSPSAINKQYIEKTVPTLTLPGFGEQFGGGSDHTFSITLTSDL